MDLAKAAERWCQRLASLTIRQDSKLSLSGGTHRRRSRPSSEKLQKAIAIFAADHAVDGGNKTRARPVRRCLGNRWRKGAINKSPTASSRRHTDMGQKKTANRQGVQNLKVMHGKPFWARRDAMVRKK